MKIKILGSVSPYPTMRCNGVGYLISNKYNKILLDCGSGIVKELDFPKDLYNLTIIISHLHKDHYSDLASIAYASFVYHNLGLLDKKIDVYIPKDEKNIDYNYLMNYGDENFMNFIPYDENTKLFINDFSINFYKTIHPVKTYAASIKNGYIKVSYSADTGYDKKIIKFFENSDYLICESSFLKNNKNGNAHLSAEDAADLALLSKSKNLILTHFWPEIDKDEYVYEAKKIFKNTESAIEGKIYKL